MSIILINKSLVLNTFVLSTSLVKHSFLYQVRTPPPPLATILASSHTNRHRYRMQFTVLSTLLFAITAMAAPTLVVGSAPAAGAGVGGSVSGGVDLDASVGGGVGVGI